MDLKSVEKYIQDSVDKKFQFVDNREKEIPFTPFSKDLSRAKIALISSAGLYLKGDKPFDIEAINGDTSFRIIPRDTTISQMNIAHTHYNHKYVRADVNTALPLELLKKLEENDIIGALAETNYSISGYILEMDELINYTSVKIEERLKKEAVDGIILAPV